MGVMEERSEKSWRRNWKSCKNLLQLRWQRLCRCLRREERKIEEVVEGEFFLTCPYSLRSPSDPPIFALLFPIRSGLARQRRPLEWRNFVRCKTGSNLERRKKKLVLSMRLEVSAWSIATLVERSELLLLSLEVKVSYSLERNFPLLFRWASSLTSIHLPSTFTAKMSKKNQNRLANLKAASSSSSYSGGGESSGTASSLSFTPIQGIELVDPSRQKKVDDANAKW